MTFHPTAAAPILRTVASGMALAVILAACQPKPGSAASADAQATLPTEALSKARYARSYLLTDVKSTEDTPFFTTSEDFDLPQPRQVWVAVYVLADPQSETTRPGLQVHAKPEQMPMAFHGGCGVVNLVADARSGETLASWCNVAAAAPDGSLQQVPRFTNPSSPFP